MPKRNQRTESDNSPRCSFCGKAKDEVKRLIAGSNGVYICDECVEICNEIIEDKEDYLHDPLLEVTELITETERKSLSVLQKRFQLGFQRAGKLMDAIEGNSSKESANGLDKLVDPEGEKKSREEIANHESEPPAFPSDHFTPNQNYTFDKFVVGDCNRMAHAAAVAVADSDEPLYNPLYIYGGHGLGKTHLLHAVGQYVMKRNPESSIVCVTAEEFTNEVIGSIRTGSAVSMAKLREKYRGADVMMIDDIQFLAGRETMAEEFFHTMNTRHRNQKIMIFTADRPPKELGLEERIYSKLEAGLTVQVSAPNYDTRMAILRKKASDAHVSIADEVLDNIAYLYKTNILELEGALARLIFLKKNHLDI